MAQEKPTNQEIAAVLEEIANLLDAQDANPFRIRSYREGAASVRSARQAVAEWVRQGQAAQLRELPNVGEGIAAVVSEYVETGQSDLLRRLRTEVSPRQRIAQVPGIGPELSQRIVEELDVRSLEDLELAAHDGRLEQVEGFGPKRIQTVRTSLAGMLSGAAQRRMEGVLQPDPQQQDRPEVETLLWVDEEYRRRAEAGELKTIAPKRFNPEEEAWLPVMSVDRDGWKFTALFSNTAQAHRLGKNRDWVVIYFKRDGREDQSTVVTGSSGELAGRRVVRGREAECKQYYKKK